MKREKIHNICGRCIDHLKFFFMMFSIFISCCVTSSLHAESMIPLTIKKGGNLIHIARQFCTSQFQWREVAKINGLKDPYTIYAGETLYVPISLLKVEKISARVTSVFGGVYIVQDKEKLKKLTKGDLILPGQTLVTEEDGFTHLVFPDHKYTRISSGSRFTLTYLVRLADQSLKAEFFLEKGRITHAVKEKLKKNETFSTRTPVSVTGVRGTEFRLKMTNGKTNIVETLAGIVTVDASGQSVNVRKGEGTRVLEGQSPEKPRKLPTPPEISGIESIYRVLPVLIHAPDDKSLHKLRLRITSDEQGETTILEKFAQPGGKFTLLALPDGIYYGFLTAIDSENFESLPAEPISFQVRTVPGAPIFSAPLSGNAVFEKSVTIDWLKTEEAEKYYFQLSKDIEFKDIVDERIQLKSLYSSPELEPGKYFFRVQAIASDGFRSLFSLTDSWKIVAQPSLGTVEGSREGGFTLRWASMGDDITYDVQISKDKKFTKLLVDKQRLETTEFVLADNVDSGTYYVRFRGVLSDGQVSPWTPSQEMVVASEPFGIAEAMVYLIFIAVILI